MSFFGPILEDKKPVLGSFGTIKEGQKPILGPLGPILKGWKPILGPFGTRLGAFWAYPHGSGEYFALIKVVSRAGF